MSQYAQARKNMVDNQLRPSGVDDPAVLEAMASVPRELFVPRQLRGIAYADEDLDLGQGRFLIEPLALARMIQSAPIGRDDIVLVTGCTTGYCAAVASRLAATVFLLVPEGTDADAIDARLGELDCANVVVQTGVPREGLPQQGPFNVILVPVAVPEVPKTLCEQLDTGGRLVTVVEGGKIGAMTVVTRIGDAFGRTTPYDSGIRAGVDFRREPGFVF